MSIMSRHAGRAYKRCRYNRQHNLVKWFLNFRIIDSIHLHSQVIFLNITFKSSILSWSFYWTVFRMREFFYEPCGFQFIINVSSGAQQASSWNFASVIGFWKLLLTHLACSISPIKRPYRSRTSWRPQSQKKGFDWSRISVDFEHDSPHSSDGGPKTEILTVIFLSN